MKSIIALSFFLLMVNITFSQEIHYQTLEAQMKITATRYDDVFQWENKKITVSLDYKTGAFIVKLNNIDFRKTMENSRPQDLDTDEVYYEFKGSLPIRDIINQKNINQSYPVELQLICESMNINQTLHFQMDITKPGSGSANFRIFSIHGKMYNDEVHIPAFKTYDNEVELWIIFNAMGSN